MLRRPATTAKSSRLEKHSVTRTVRQLPPLENGCLTDDSTNLVTASPNSNRGDLPTLKKPAPSASIKGPSTAAGEVVQPSRSRFVMSTGGKPPSVHVNKRLTLHDILLPTSRKDKGGPIGGPVDDQYLEQIKENIDPVTRVIHGRHALLGGPSRAPLTQPQQEQEESDEEVKDEEDDRRTITFPTSFVRGQPRM